MKFISTKTHGVLDYLSGILLIIAPWILGFATGGPAQWIPVIVGVMIIGLSIFTSYELGAVRMIPMRTHLTIDVLTGIFLAVSPWLFGFAETVFWPHLILGLMEMGAGIFTKVVPEYGADVVRK